MRSAEQVSRTPEQWADYKQAKRRRTPRDLLASLLRAREQRAEWYVWVVEGMPRLTVEQYEAVKAKRARRRQSA